jgi:hypothetical protein
MLQTDDRQHLVWCGLNDEGRELAALLGDSCVLIEGSDTEDKRIERETAWRTGQVKVLISKPSIFGFGMNWQHCSNQAFVGVNDSYEGFYQAVRRSWRFGQRRTVNIHVFASNQDGAVVANIKRKQAAADEMYAQMSADTLDAVRESVLGARKNTNDYNASRRVSVPSFLVSA